VWQKKCAKEERDDENPREAPVFKKYFRTGVLRISGFIKFVG